MLLWPILLWQLNLMIRRTRDAKGSDVCFQTNALGFITIRYAAYQPDPSLYRPVERIFRELSDPNWETSLPANPDLESAEACFTFVLVREAGGGVWTRGVQTAGGGLA